MVLRIERNKMFSNSIVRAARENQIQIDLTAGEKRRLQEEDPIKLDDFSREEEGVCDWQVSCLYRAICTK